MAFSQFELMADQTMIQMLQVAAQAAQAASEAADSMRKMVERDDNDKKQQSSQKLAKWFVCLIPLGSEDQDQDQKGWRDFLHNFKSWLYYADGSFEAGSFKC